AQEASKQRAEAEKQRELFMSASHRLEVLIGLASSAAGSKSLQHTCSQAIDVVAMLVTTSDKVELTRAQATFWELYNGPMYIVETHQWSKSGGRTEIEASMVRFGRRLKEVTEADEPLPLSSLCPLAKAVRTECNNYFGLTTHEPCT